MQALHSCSSAMGARIFSNVGPGVRIAPDAVLANLVEPSSGSLLSAGETSLFPIGNLTDDEGAAHDLDVTPVLLSAFFDDRFSGNIAISIELHVDFLEVLPLFLGHIDLDLEVPVLALVLHHSLVLELPVIRPIVVLNQANATATEAEVRLVVVDPFDKVVVLGTEIMRRRSRSRVGVVVVIVITVVVIRVVSGVVSGVISGVVSGVVSGVIVVVIVVVIVIVVSVVGGVVGGVVIVVVIVRTIVSLRIKDRHVLSKDSVIFVHD